MRAKRRKRPPVLFGLFLIICRVLELAVVTGAVIFFWKSGFFENACFVSENGDRILEPIRREEKEIKNCWIPISGLSQNGVPTGCEAVSTVAVLNYYGVEITVQEFIDGYLPQGVFWKKDGRIYGPNPHEVFAGTPYESGGLGCFSEVIVQTLEHMKEAGIKGMKERTIENVSGNSFKELVNQYLAENIPVIVWVTMDMREPKEGMSYYLADGSRYVWQAGEHCMVLCGMDEKQYYLLDSLAGGEAVGYERRLVELRYEQMGQQAVVVK